VEENHEKGRKEKNAAYLEETEKRKKKMYR
jgi:hypothetical protein